jgi:rhodanese-related sulfurtransferase
MASFTGQESQLCIGETTIALGGSLRYPDDSPVFNDFSLCATVESLCATSGAFLPSGQGTVPGRAAGVSSRATGLPSFKGTPPPFKGSAPSFKARVPSFKKIAPSTVARASFFAARSESAIRLAPLAAEDNRGKINGDGGSHGSVRAPTIACTCDGAVERIAPLSAAAESPPQRRRRLVRQESEVLVTTNGTPLNPRTMSQRYLRQLMDRKVKMIVIDVLDAEQFSESHLPGAINIPLGDEFELAVAAEVPDKHSKVVVYSEGGSCGDSTRAANRLAAMGYELVADFKGGKMAWREAEAASHEDSGAPTQPAVASPPVG